MAERSRLQLYAVELPGRGCRADEATISDFQQLLESLKPDVMTWARKYKRLWHEKFWNLEINLSNKQLRDA